MLKALTAQGFTREELSTAGLVSTGQRGVYDRFRGRLVWPIRDVSGQPLRSGSPPLFPYHQGPQYLHTPDTPIHQPTPVPHRLIPAHSAPPPAFPPCVTVPPRRVLRLLPLSSPGASSPTPRCH